jgi:hypothetical protein
MLFALISEDETSYTVLTLLKDVNGHAHYTKSKLSKKIASLGALAFSEKNIEKIIKELLHNSYGWGGMYGERDCSSTIRDFYAPFALWLPRNSSKQSLEGKRIILSDLSKQEKLSLIRREAKPFQTLLYKRGHIALYVGLHKNKPVVFQNVWGVKTKIEGKEGRYIIGKPIFSTLEVGKNLSHFDENSSLLENIKVLNTL